MQIFSQEADFSVRSGAETSMEKSNVSNGSSNGSPKESSEYSLDQQQSPVSTIAGVQAKTGGEHKLDGQSMVWEEHERREQVPLERVKPGKPKDEKVNLKKSKQIKTKSNKFI